MMIGRACPIPYNFLSTAAGTDLQVLVSGAEGETASPPRLSHSPSGGPGYYHAADATTRGGAPPSHVVTGVVRLYWLSELAPVTWPCSKRGGPRCAARGRCFLVAGRIGAAVESCRPPHGF
jgi:hypothetical protein